ncbi:MAG TPA: hypothetical protein VJ995_07930 [Geothermobacteraceae bacterium]|nr:hypothetical protein [Geothermobacteraceae bacterium]
MVGLTHPIPLEIPFAPKQQAQDLHRLSLDDSNSQGLYEEAELAGFPQQGCNVIKGISGAALRHGILHSPTTSCSGQAEDLHFRQQLKLPLLTLRTDPVGPLDTSSRMLVTDFNNRLQEQAHR